MSDFDPRQHLTKLQGKDYLEVRWRLAWLRADHPGAIISTELLAYDVEHKWAIVRAIVSLPDGGSATGMVYQEPSGVAKDWIANGETSAIGRALGALGYGTQFALEFDQGADVADSQIERKPPQPTARELSGQPERKPPTRPAAAPPVVADATADAKRAATEAAAVKAALVQRLVSAMKAANADPIDTAGTARLVFNVTRWGDLTPEQIEQVIDLVEDRRELRIDEHGTARLVPVAGLASLDEVPFEVATAAEG